MRVTIALLALSVAARPELLDRIAVTVDFNVITESEILRQIRLTAFLNGVPADLSRQNKRDTADRLVEQMLIRREMQLSRMGVDSKAGAEASYAALRARFANEPAYRSQLAAFRLSDDDVKVTLLWQANFLEFVSLRFRPGIQIPEEELREYFEREIRPLPPNHPEARLSYEEARPQIESILMDQRVDNAVDRWLGQTRTQTRILYHEEVFR